MRSCNGELTLGGRHIDVQDEPIPSVIRFESRSSGVLRPLAVLLASCRFDGRRTGALVSITCLFQNV